MDIQIIRQPDGNFALFSSESDTLGLWAASAADIVAHVADGRPERVYYQFAMSWGSCGGERPRTRRLVLAGPARRGGTDPRAPPGAGWHQRRRLGAHIVGAAEPNRPGHDAHRAQPPAAAATRKKRRTRSRDAVTALLYALNEGGVNQSWMAAAEHAMAEGQLVLGSATEATLHDSDEVTVTAMFDHFDGWVFVCAYTQPTIHESQGDAP